MDIDIKNFAGEQPDSAAEGQQTNSYQQEANDGVEVYKEFLSPPEPVQDQFVEPNKMVQEAPEAPSKQELNFKAFREEIDKIKSERESERREYQQNLDLLRVNLQQRQPEPAPQPKKMFDNLEDTDIPNVADIRKAWDQRESEYRARIEELQVAQTHPDYAEVLEKYTAPLIKEKPHLAEGFQSSSNKALYAYELGKMRQQQQQYVSELTKLQQQSTQPPATQPNASAQRIVENASKPRTLAQAGGQSALSQADYFASMSDQEFMKFASKNLGEI